MEFDKFKQSAFRTSKISAPSRLQGLGDRIDGVNDHKDAYHFYTNRGVRDVSNAGLCSMEYNDETLRAAAALSRELISAELVEENPELEEVVKRVSTYIDPLTEPEVRDLNKQSHGIYRMSDKSFNLTPNRADNYLLQYKAIITKRAGDGDTTYKDLEDKLNARCSRAEGCYYRKVYPEFKCAGPVAMPDSIKNIFTYVLPASPFKGKTINLILHMINNPMDEAGESMSDPIVKAMSQCLVCTIINNAEKDFKISASQVNNKTEEPLYLMNIEDEDSEMFMTITIPQFDSCVAEVDVPRYTRVRLPMIRFREFYRPYQNPTTGIWEVIHYPEGWSNRDEKEDEFMSNV
nr:ORF94 [Ostreid herpesvirus 1]